MEQDIIKHGGSLKVPNVQELAKNNLDSVPDRFVRSVVDRFIPEKLSSSLEIPVIDMGKLSNSDSELEKLHKACQEWGFFQLINHGVDFQVMETMKLEIEKFFNLPLTEKNKFSQRPGDIEGYGQAFVVSEDQKLDWCDMFVVVTSSRKPHLIPKLPESFRNAIDVYSEELNLVGLKLLRLMAKALNMKVEETENLFDEMRQSIRMNYYPPCPQPELVTGLSPHSDAGLLTILLQVNETQGLEVKKDGVWVPVYPLSDAFIVNVGNIMEIVSNGAYQSVEHRATANSEIERISAGTFIYPRFDLEIGPLPSFITDENPAKFKRVLVGEYYKAFVARKLDGKSYLDALRI